LLPRCFHGENKAVPPKPAIFRPIFAGRIVLLPGPRQIGSTNFLLRLGATFFGGGKWKQ